jgi:hypothetical protein
MMKRMRPLKVLLQVGMLTVLSNEVARYMTSRAGFQR